MSALPLWPSLRVARRSFREVQCYYSYLYVFSANRKFIQPQDCGSRDARITTLGAATALGGPTLHKTDFHRKLAG